MKDYKVIAFDLDGTLTDPYEGLTRAHVYGLKRVGIIGLDRKELKKYIGPPLKDAWMEDFGISEEVALSAISYFREYFSVYGWWDNVLYGGVEDLLARLKKSGKKIVLATSKPEVFAIKILKKFGIYDYFDFVGAATLDHKRDSKESVLRFVLDNLPEGVTEENVLLVGDTKYDLEGAEAVGIDFLGVSYGYGEREDFLGHSFVDGTEEIGDFILGDR